MDRYQKFGLFAIVLALFLMLAISQGSERILMWAGVVYGLVFVFHKPLERLFIERLKRPLLAYGILVVLNGLFVEVLAFLGNADKIRATGQADLFATTSLNADLLVSLPYYIVNAAVFMWAVKRYKFTIFKLGVIIWLFNAVFVDAVTIAPFVFIGKHFLALLHFNVIEFVVSGIMMLFTLHAAIVLFENKFQEIYPNRSHSWKKYPIVFALQYLPLMVTFAILFIGFNLFG